MTAVAPEFLRHDHVVYRVVKQRWTDALDTSFSKEQGGRWNPPAAFPVLYTCCSVSVARSVTRDLFTVGSVEPADLPESERPQLVEIEWTGEVVDVVTVTGVEAAGFPPDYPSGVGFAQTQPVGAAWHADGCEGLLCRSASLGRAGMRNWNLDHRDVSELAIFIQNAKATPRPGRRITDLAWLLSPS